MNKPAKKRSGFELQMATKNGSQGTSLFLKTPHGAYHAFLEVAAKDAARDCGVLEEGNTRTMCKNLLGF